MQIFIVPKLQVYRKFKLSHKPKNLSNRNKNTTFVEGNDVNNSAKFQLFQLTASEMIF